MEKAAFSIVLTSFRLSLQCIRIIRRSISVLLLFSSAIIKRSAYYASAPDNFREFVIPERSGDKDS